MEKVFIVVGHTLGDSLYCHHVKAFLHKALAQEYADNLNDIAMEMYSKQDEWSAIVHELTIIEGDRCGDYERHEYISSLEKFTEYITNDITIKNNHLIKKYTVQELINMFNFFENGDTIYDHYTVEDVELVK